MKTLKQIAIAATSIILLVFIIGLFLSQEVVVQRNMAVKAPQKLVFAMANDLELFNRWNPWTPGDDSDLNWGDRKSGLGAFQSWVVEKEPFNEGSLEIVDSEPFKRVKTELKFTDEEATYGELFVDQGNNFMTEVNWLFTINMGWNPIHRVLGRLMDIMAGPFLENGLYALGGEVQSVANEMMWGGAVADTTVATLIWNYDAEDWKPKSVGYRWIPFAEMKDDQVLEVMCTPGKREESEVAMHTLEEQMRRFQIESDQFIFLNDTAQGPRFCVVIFN